MSIPLPLPPDYDPAAHMIAKVTENGVFHESRAGAALAERLVENGAPEDLALARQVLEVVLRSQETHPEDLHYGNFLWMIEDEVVFDLNAVEFNLEHLIPMLLRHSDRLPVGLPTDLRRRLLAAVRLGLAEIEKLDVQLSYTNIAVLDILNTCLGGELLKDAALLERGRAKLTRWMELTAQHGAPVEYNSPTYANVVIRSLARLAELTSDPEVRVRAQVALARVGLSAALHIHPATGRWAGPHSRAYHPSVLCETPPEIDLLRGYIADGTLPAWLASALDERPAAFQITETAYAISDGAVGRGLGLTTYHAPAFALGVSPSQYGGQSDVCILHYERPGCDKPGVLYTRYLLNDKWLGDFYHATDRTKSRNLIEEGRFYGVQDGSRAIGLYTLPNSPGVIRSAKAALIWVGASQVDEIWLEGNNELSARVTSLPAEVPPGAVVVIASCRALMAVRPLAATNLGRGRGAAGAFHTAQGGVPIRLVEKEGDLVLEIYNYLGAAKPFWELDAGSAFYQGAPRCGFYLEVAERSAYPDARSFGEEVASGALDEDWAPPFTYRDPSERPWRVAYTRAGHSLGLEVDLMGWKLRRRWVDGQDLGWPMLESPIARENRSGAVCVGDAADSAKGSALGAATLTTGSASAWLYACPPRQLYVAAVQGPAPAPFRLEVPGGRVELAALQVGLVVWDRGKVEVSGIGLEGDPQIEGGSVTVL